MEISTHRFSTNSGVTRLTAIPRAKAVTEKHSLANRLDRSERRLILRAATTRTSEPLRRAVQFRAPRGKQEPEQCPVANGQ